MSLAAWTLRNRHTVWALSIGIAFLGVVAYISLPIQLFPDTAPPLVTVVTAVPGASASDIANDVSDPLEKAFLALEGVTQVQSTSLDNLSMLRVEFAYDRVRALAAVDVQNAVARTRPELPESIAEPQVLSFSTVDRPVITLGATLPSLGEARRLAEDELAPRLQRIPGVAAVDVFGGNTLALVVEVQPQALHRHGLSIPQVAGAIRVATASAPAGRLRTERGQRSFRVEAPAGDIAALATTPIPLPDGSTIRLQDIARLQEQVLDDDARFAIDGQAAIALQVFKTTEANTAEVVQAVRELAMDLEAQYPGLQLLEGEETATFTDTAVSNLLEGVWQALLLASIILFLFLGHLRSAAVAIVSMPMSYGLTFGLMYVSGVQLDMVTLSAVILAVGMVVDASVVVLENVTRLREEEGYEPEQAAIEGTDQIRGPVLAGAATTLTVLIPLTLLPGFVGKTFGPLALTLVFAFSSSLVVALFLVPVLTLYTSGNRWFDRAGLLVARPFELLMQGVRALYGALLRLALRARIFTLVLAVALLALSARTLLKQGMDVLPHMDSGSFFISMETTSDSSLGETARAVGELEAMLAAEPEVLRIQSQIGFEPGMRSSNTHGVNQAYLSLTLSDRTAREESIWEIEARVRERIWEIPGITHAVVREVGNTARPTSAAPVVLRIRGADALVLDRIAPDLLERLAEIPNIIAPTRSWHLDQRQTRLVVDELRARNVGLSNLDVAMQFAAAMEGVPAGVLRGRSNETLPVRVRAARDAWHAPADLLELSLVTPRHPGGVSAAGLVELDEVDVQTVITREEGLATLDLSATVEGRALSLVTADIEAMLAEFVFPEGYEASLSGENDDLETAKRDLGGALLFSILAVYLLLVSQLRSFLHPVTILMSLPLSLIGVAAALLLTGKSISMPVMVGLILLAGTVVNNAIILLDFILERREAGLGRREALLESVQTRFRPIMMTSLSTIVGMIPLAGEWGLGTERFSPLAIAVIGGMTVSTLLTLLIIPVAYDLFDSLQARLTRGRATQ